MRARRSLNRCLLHGNKLLRKGNRRGGVGRKRFFRKKARYSDVTKQQFARPWKSSKKRCRAPDLYREGGRKRRARCRVGPLDGDYYTGGESQERVFSDSEKGEVVADRL